MSAAEVGVRFPSVGVPSASLEGHLGVFDDHSKHAAVVLCHPGVVGPTGMEYPVIAACTDALQQGGFITLRFNFRGVQGSTGERSGGLHEANDVFGAMHLLRQRADVDAERLYLVGDSFGAWMALEAARADARVAGLACIVLPLALLPSRPDWLQHDARPKLFVAAEHDQFCDWQAFKPLYQTWAEPKDLLLLAGSDHFLGIGSSVDTVDRSAQIAGAVAAWARRVSMVRPDVTHTTKRD